MTTKLNSNGFGSFHKHLIFTVTKLYSELLIKDGWDVVQETIIGTEFKFCFTGRGKGDDETALWELGYALPDGVPDNCWRVCWERSVY